jgi:hypothetical protein
MAPERKEGRRLGSVGIVVDDEAEGGSKKSYDFCYQHLTGEFRARSRTLVSNQKYPSEAFELNGNRSEESAVCSRSWARFRRESSSLPGSRTRSPCQGNPTTVVVRKQWDPLVKHGYLFPVIGHRVSSSTACHGLSMSFISQSTRIPLGTSLFLPQYL